MAAEASKFRLQLRKFVRQAWLSDEAAKIQDELRKRARALIEEGYERCAREARPITECYREVAKEAGLSKAFREVWGTA